MKQWKKTAINFSESKLMELIDRTMCEENIFLTTDELDSTIGELENYMNQLEITFETGEKLSGDLQNVISDYTSYAYKEGFKEGIRLFRTLMNL